mgnify:CR=1 FL=1
MNVLSRGPLTIAFFGSSLVSAYWNGAATYYRGILRELAARGHRITFYEPDAFDRQQHRDIDDPPWARVNVYANSEDAVLRALEATGADARLVATPEGLGAADRVVFPGVGAAPSAVAALQAAALWEPVRDWARAGRPLLGVCLGAQLLARLDEGAGVTVAAIRVPRPEGSMVIGEAPFTAVSRRRYPASIALVMAVTPSSPDSG